MCEPVREWRFYLDDMVIFAEKVLAYTEGLDQAGFEASALHYDATLRNLGNRSLPLLLRERTGQPRHAVNTSL